MFQKDKKNFDKNWYSRHCASLKKLVLLLDDILHSFVSISEVGSNFLLFYCVYQKFLITCKIFESYSTFWMIDLLHSSNLILMSQLYPWICSSSYPIRFLKFHIHIASNGLKTRWEFTNSLFYGEQNNMKKVDLI